MTATVGGIIFGVVVSLIILGIAVLKEKLLYMIWMVTNWSVTEVDLM